MIAPDMVMLKNGYKEKKQRSRSACVRRDPGEFPRSGREKRETPRVKGAGKERKKKKKRGEKKEIPKGKKADKKKKKKKKKNKKKKKKKKKTSETFRGYVIKFSPLHPLSERNAIDD